MIELIKEIIEQDGLANKNRKREIVHGEFICLGSYAKTVTHLKE
jgi:hypothetical protein